MQQQDTKPRQVVRQTTLPAYSPRHQNFHRQLSHNIGLEAVPFKVCNVTQKDSVGEIKPELYKPELVKQSSTESCVLSSPKPDELCGKLTFSLRYDTDIEGLLVKVHQAENLPAKDFSGTSDPYIKIYLLPDRRRKFQTKVHRRNLNPVFNETFVFGVARSELSSRKLQFSVIDFDRFSRHDLIGHVTLRNIVDDSDLSEECTYTMDIIKEYEESVGRGEVMVSLCYLPTAGRLTATIIKARFLKAMDITGASDPYVKVSLVCQGKRIRKKKTTVKKSTLNPVYNEALVFDVPAENIESVSLMIKVLDYDRIGANELIGCTAIGATFIGSSREHWQEMIANPRKPVAMWHTLVDDVPGMPPMTPPAYSIKRFQSFDFGSCATSKECQ